MRFRAIVRLRKFPFYAVYLYIFPAYRYRRDMKGSASSKENASANALAHDLRRVAGKLRRRLREQAGVGDFTPSQTSVLLRIEKDGPSTASGLARLEGMRPQSMAAIVAVLESAGLIRGAPDPADGRQTLLSLTDHCRTWLGVSRAARQDWLARTMLDRLSADERDQLAAAVALLARLVDD